jgi:hypothetical protein
MDENFPISCCNESTFHCCCYITVRCIYRWSEFISGYVETAEAISSLSGHASITVSPVGSTSAKLVCHNVFSTPPTHSLYAETTAHQNTRLNCSRAQISAGPGNRFGGLLTRGIVLWALGYQHPYKIVGWDLLHVPKSWEGILYVGSWGVLSHRTHAVVAPLGLGMCDCSSGGTAFLRRRSSSLKCIRKNWWSERHQKNWWLS